MIQIEETFRHSNLLVKTIKEMQHKQIKSLDFIQIKLNQMAKVNDILEATNKFKPNSCSFDQLEEVTNLFDSIQLNGYSNMNSFKSEILTNERQMSVLIDLCEFAPNDKWSLLYRGTRDGFRSNDFHSKCDGHSNTLTIFKAKENSYIFEGFTTVEWDTSSKWKSDANAFLFSLTNKDNQPLKMKINTNKHQSAFRCNSEFSPIFGCDICIGNNANTTMDSRSNLGHTYKHPQYGWRTYRASTFLAFNWIKLKFIKRNKHQTKRFFYFKYFTSVFFERWTF